jgi:hypothetical protein
VRVLDASIDFRARVRGKRVTSASSRSWRRERGGRSTNVAHRYVQVALASLCALTVPLALTAAPGRAADLHNYLFQFGEVPAVGPHGEAIAQPGPLTRPKAMTVDSGEVYVAEGFSPARIDKFNAATGTFIGQFPQESPPLEDLTNGIAVGHASGQTRVYVGGDELVEGSPFGVVAVFSSTGELQTVWKGRQTLSKGFDHFEGRTSVGAVAVDNSSGLGDWAQNDVYVPDPENKVVDVFEPETGTGEGKPVAELTGVSPSEPFNEPYQVAVSTLDGEVAVADWEVGVDLFKPAAIPGQYEFVGKLNPPSGIQLSGPIDLDASDGEGDIYVTASGSNNVLEFNSAGEYEGQITPEALPGDVWGPPSQGRPTVPVAVTADPATHQVYIGTSDGSATEPRAAFVFSPNVVIPDVATQPPSNIKPESATLNGTVNLDGAGPATCQFVYGTSRQFGHTAKCPAAVTAEGAPVAVHAEVALQPDTTYYYRLQATNGNGTNFGDESQDQEFTTTGPGIQAESATNVGSSSVTLNATIDPNESPTSYYFQYGAGGGYSAEVPLAPGVSIGSEKGGVEVAQRLRDLTPGTIYHYRVVAVSEVGGARETFDGPGQTFVTQSAGGEFMLLDGRRWEMVSPPNKRGGLIQPLSGEPIAQSAADGEAMTFFAQLPPAGSKPQGNSTEAQIFSTRGSEGWTSQDIGLPHAYATGAAGGIDEYPFFSEDMSRALAEQGGVEEGFTSLEPDVSPPDTEATPYLRHDFTCETAPASCFEPLITGAPGDADAPAGFGRSAELDAATPDLAHVILDSVASVQLYEWSAGAPPAEELLPVSILPKGEGETFVAGERLGRVAANRHAISEDGSRVVWTRALDPGSTGLYLRDMTKGETVRLDAVKGGSGEGAEVARFQVASPEGSKVFFTDTQRLTREAGRDTGEPDLYECEIVEEAQGPACVLTDLTSAGAQPSAGVQGSVLGTSEDGSYVYFVATGVLGSGESARHEQATPGADNLYMLHYDAATRAWEPPVFIATLAAQDGTDWTAVPYKQPTRVSPNGRYLTFMSSRSLTGYDNQDANNPGEADEEVFLFDALHDRLACASCNPTGARPVGIEYGSFETSNEEVISGSPRLTDEGDWPSSTWVAAQTPGWTGLGAHQSRYLSDEGRLFFDSRDALVPQDIDNNEDVYEYEPAGVGSCTTTAPTFSESAGGCVDLISSGTSSTESAFLDASENGEDVFFLTTEKLVPQDRDVALDVYDAHMCTSLSPCVNAPAPPPACTTADACRAAPLPQPPIFGAPASATFSGAGNLVPSSPVKSTKPTTKKRKATRCPRGRKLRHGKCAKPTGGKRAKGAKRAAGRRRARAVKAGSRGAGR